MGRVFVMGDIHGCYKALMQCLERSGFDYDNDMLIQLGDVVDGWPEVYECVEELLKIKNLIAIRGNHDDWFREFIEIDRHGSNWRQGADATLKSYLFHAGKEKYYSMIVQDIPVYGKLIIPEDIPKLHRDFFTREQKNFAIIETGTGRKLLFVHGGFNRHYPFKQTPEYLLYWDRDLWSQALSWQAMNEVDRERNPFKMKDDFSEIYIGHTTTQFWNHDKPMKAAMITNMDTGAGWAGYLSMMNIETKELFQSDEVRSLYPNEKGRNR